MRASGTGLGSVCRLEDRLGDEGSIQEFGDLLREAVEIGLGEGQILFDVFVCVTREEDGVGQALERIVDAMGEGVGHLRCGNGFFAGAQQLLLMLVAEDDGGEVREAAEEAVVFGAEGLGGGMGDGPEGAAQKLVRPGDE